MNRKYSELHNGEVADGRPAKRSRLVGNVLTENQASDVENCIRGTVYPLPISQLSYATLNR